MEYKKTKRIYVNRIYFLLIALLLSTVVFAQQVTVKGKVTDKENGDPLPGVSVLVKGAVKGTVTDVNGSYHLDVPPNATLIFTFIGYLKEEIIVSNQDVINIQLAQDIKSLGEVIVIGYGEAYKKEITGSIATVKGEDLQKMTVGNSADALQGRAAGIQVISNGGAPGAAPEILIRGVTSFNNDKSPLIVLDGIMLPTGTNLNFLNPQDIQDFQILKDASASAIYGSRASNGVILITSKRGQQGKAVVTLDFSNGVDNLKKINVADAQEYAQMVNQRRINDGSAVKFNDSEIANMGKGTDWWDETLVNYAPIQNYNLGVSGGKEDLRYSASVGYYKKESNYTKGDWEKITARFNVDYKISDKVSFKQDLSPRLIKGENTPNLLWNILRIDPLTDVYLPFDQRTGKNEFSIFGRSDLGVPNPVGVVARQFNESRQFALFTNTQLSYQPIEGLDLTSQLGLNIVNNRSDVFNPMFDIHPNEQNLINKVSRGMSERFDWVLNNTATYQRRIGEHKIVITGGVVLDEQRVNNVSASREDIPGQQEELRYINAATGEGMTVGGTETVRTMFSYLGRVMYNYQDKYFLTAAVRRDASSVFPKQNKWGTFPSVSAGWSITDENFFKVPFINTLKLKAGYGQLGNQNIDLAAQFFGIGNSNYVFGGDRVVTNTLNRFGNSELKWETVEDINVGLEGTLFGNRLNFSVERYRRSSIDLLFDVEPPNYTGIPATITQNIGSMGSKGWDLSLGYGQTFRAFHLNVSANISTNESRLKEIAPGIEELLGQKREDLGNRYLKISRLGEIVGLFYGFKTDGIFQNQTEINSHSNAAGIIVQPNAQPGDLRFVDQNNDGQLTDDDLTILGNPFPKFTAGINFDFSFKNWDMSMQWYGVFGNDVINYTNLFMYSGINDVNVKKGALNEVWSEANPNAKYPRLSQLDRNQNYQRPSDLFVEDGSFLRLKNLQVGYKVPVKGFNKLRVFMSVQNPLTFTKYSGFDPEVSAGGNIIQGYGVDYAGYPLSRTYLAGFNVSF